MATLNVGAMAARLGLDPSEFLEKMRGVEGFNSGLNQRMSAEMKRTAREGAESFRLIDESLGIHVSRPLTKILTREFPAFASALQSIVGVGVVGALGAVAFEFGEHIAKKMEEARKKEEEYTDAVLKTKNVIAEARAESERRLNETLGKDAGVRGDRAAEAYYKGLATDAENVQRLAKFTDQLTEALHREAAAAAAQMPIWLALGKIWHEMFSSAGTLGAEKINQQVKEFQEQFDKLSQRDALKHTTTAAEYLNEELAKAARELDAMTTAAAAPPKRMVVAGGFVTDAPGTITPKEIEAKVKYLDVLTAIKNEQKASVDEASATKQLERDTEAKKMAEEVAKAIEKIREAQKRTLEESNRLGKELHGALDKKDEVQQLDDAFAHTMATLAQYRALVGGTAFFKEFGVSADQLAQQLAAVTGQLESQAQLKRFMEETKETRGDVPEKFPMAFGAPAMPSLVHGGAVAGELAAFAEEPKKQIEMMKKAFEEAMTPLEKFTVAQRELDSILKNADGTFRAGAEGAAAYAGAMRHLVDEEIRADEASKRATDGMQGFILALQQGEANGKFTFSFASTMFKDFEDGIAKTILATRNQHYELRRMWENYFKQLEEMAIKFALSKSFASLANLGGTGASAGSGARAAGGIAGLLAKLFSSFGGGGAGAGAGAGATAAGSTIGESLNVPFFAEGGDATPGSSFISGEAGAERVDLTRGGAHITPLGTGGSSTTIHNDFRGTVMTDDLMRRAEAMQAMRASEERSVARSVSMQSEIAKRSRPNR